MPKRLPSILSLLFIIVFAACKKVDIQFGDQFLDNAYTQIIKIDSFTARLSTVYVDSFVTSGSGVTLVGGYNDTSLGRTDVQNFLEVNPPPYSDIYANSTFDSLILILKLNRSYYGDTTKPLHIDVNRLSQPIVPYYEGSGIYNTQQFSVNTTPIGSGDVIIRPNITDTVFIRLNDNLGKELLRKLQDPTDVDVLSTAGFLSYFYGLRLSSPTNSALVFGATDSVIMRLHYTKADLYQQHNRVDFVVGNSAHHFSHITTDRSATLLKNISSANNEIPSSLTQNKTFSQYTAGVMTKITFPSLKEILKLPNYAKILKATLIIRPVKGSYSPLYYLPPALRLTTTTQLNQTGVDLTRLSASGTTTEVQPGDLLIDYLYGENTNYTYDITNYLKAMLTDLTDNKNGLLLLAPVATYTTEFSRVVVGDKNNPQGKIELQILYAAVQ